MASEIRSLNPYIKIDNLGNSSINEDLIRNFSIFILTDCYDQILIDGWNILCRKHKVGFITVNSVGLMGSMFVDFG